MKNSLHHSHIAKAQASQSYKVAALGELMAATPEKPLTYARATEQAHVVKVRNQKITEMDACLRLTAATKFYPLPYQDALKLAEGAFGVDENMAAMMVATGIEEGVILPQDAATKKAVDPSITYA